MPASDKPYRSQKTLDIIFAVSCVLMLLSIFWMLYDDYTRPFKTIQRAFRDIEVDVNERAMLTALPSENQIQEVRDLGKAIKEARTTLNAEKSKIQKKLDALLSEKGQLVVKQLGTKADLDSLSSIYNIQMEEAGSGNGKETHKFDKAKETQKKVEKLGFEYDAITRKVDAKQAEIDDLLRSSGVKEKEDDLVQQEDKLKKLTGEFDRLAKSTAQKTWKFGDWLRGLPILDGFAPPTKIQQVTLKELTIDFGGFANVTRYDRCTTCHLGIDRSNYDRATLVALGQSPSELENKLKALNAFIKERQDNGETLTFDPSDLPKTVRTTKLTAGQVTQFCAHPRLDLFVDANSKHPVESFGCTICHAGQGSATDFDKSAHVPATLKQTEEWDKLYHWERERDWDFPMLSSRFVEASCVKCHYQLTGLVTKGSRLEAPKLLKGYELVKDLGCFGCHEIAAIKSGREVGPDLRLEPIPPLEALTPEEQAKMKADPLNLPGTMRKVGPSLYRLVEKTNPEWTRKWITSPRGFRPDTKMPHFYGLSTNSPDILPEEQKKFPDAEIQSIVHYLFDSSGLYLEGKDLYRVTGEARKKELDAKEKDKSINDKEKKELAELTRRLELTRPPTPIAKQITDETGKIVELPAEPADAKTKAEEIEKGRRLFLERGCLACHSHEASAKPVNSLPGVPSEQHFGPNLSRIAAKIAPEKGDKRRWLVQWLLNPMVHFPRTRMPNVHLSVEQAGSIADWLLSQPIIDKDEYEAWNKNAETASLDTLIELARVYLLKAPNMTRHDVDEVLGKTGETNPQGFSESLIKSLLIKEDADEMALKTPIDEGKLKWYIGKKSIGRLGCYACHNIPGFETAKPIGTALNDWGKKDPERLAFEDIVTFVKDRYHLVDARDDADNKALPSKEWKKEGDKLPYEKFFFEALENHGREGFLHQKLTDTRSYDYGRLRTWDDRLRMPQFKFARTLRGPEESDEDFESRSLKEEEEAREAVMTFVLGLVGEPIPLKYVYKPQGDRLAEIKGREVLEKFNCAGCHQLRPGVYEYKLTDDAKRLLAGNFDKAARSFISDHIFPDHNAWVSPVQPNGDKLTVVGVYPSESEQGVTPDDENKVPVVKLRLIQALKAPILKSGEGDEEKRETVDIPAASEVTLLKSNLLSENPTWGGNFADLMVPYAVALDPNSDKRSLREGKPLDLDVSTARTWLPPPLEHEGERVQPGWLFSFLKNPEPIRPTSRMLLRMPRFNMSDEEAMALVNYFAAADRLENPAAGLTAPYLSVEQHDDIYWRNQTADYVARLGPERLAKKAEEMKPVWRAQAEESRATLERNLKAFQENRKSAKTDEEKASIDKEVARLEKEASALKAQLDKNDFSFFRKDWESREVYAIDAYHMLTHATKSLCITCHGLGAIPAQQGEKGPNLALSFQRLRPEWTQRWLANPRRLFAYDPIMPQNYPKDQNVLPEFFEGTSFQKLTALRDVLMNLPMVADLPANRNYFQSTLGGK